LYTSKAERAFKRSLVSLEKVMNGEVKAWIQNEMGNKEKWVAAYWMMVVGGSVYTIQISPRF